MDFDFLPNLPKSDLDDRAYKDLVEECLLRIPRYCPEWTNHNPSDPGTTLIEMFAWLTDQMQQRFNQVPRRNYVTFLELLGIQLDPPRPAHTALTFYLTSAQDFPITIPQDTEVATERTATEEAIIFSTDAPLIVGNPCIRHFLTATSAADPRQETLENPFINTVYERNRDWRTIEQTELFTEYQIGNCFYLVLDTLPTQEVQSLQGNGLPPREAQSLQGNVLEITFRGEAATGTGINPDEPPRVWQAWDGKEWQPVLRQEADDRTKGFNFGSAIPGQPRLQEASVILHLPANLPITQFNTEYQGCWIRCVYQRTRKEEPELQAGYSTPPRILGFSVRSIGGTTAASQCIRVQEEFLGVSTGKPGQTFQLQMQPVLERQSGETIEVRIPREPAESWEEVPDFSRSSADSRHYTIDSRQGVVQFGPLIREPGRLQQQTRDRARIQTPFQPVIRRIYEQNGARPTRSLEESSQILGFAERQYGKIPPPGAEIYMLSYRFGGGVRGNVEPEKLVVMRSSLPYISRVTNYAAAVGGAEAESLQDAVMRVPQLLRTREAAVTPEDFEATAKRFPGQPIARAHCLTQLEYTTPGVVRLLVVPQVQSNSQTATQGMYPDQVFRLDNELRRDLHDYFRDRRPLGIHVKFEEPEYVGVSVQVSVLLDSKYNNANARADIAMELQTLLYQFLNPLTGGIEGEGWELERPVYVSDIISLCQKVRGVRHLGQVQLYEVRKQDGLWTLYEAPDSTVDPGPFGLICSWLGGELRSFCRDKQNSAHEIQFME